VSPNMGRAQAQRVRRIFAYALLTAAIVVTVLPMLWAVGTSFKAPSDYFTRPPRLLPAEPTTMHYRALFEQVGFQRFLVNSAKVMIASTAIALAAGVTGAYSVTRFGTGGRIFLLLVLAQRMAPPVAIAIPFFILMLRLSLLNTWVGLTVTHVAMNLAVALWLMIGFFREVPRELDEAAMVDGCNRFSALVRVVLPLVAPGIAATAILISVFSWNEFFFAVVMTRTAQSQTVPVVVSSFVIPSIGFEWGLMAAAGVVSILPVLGLVFFAQRYLVKGLVSGSVKG
jgi:multiple sugar transport system permease protein